MKLSLAQSYANRENIFFLFFIAISLVSFVSHGQLLSDSIQGHKPETIWQIAKYDAKQTVRSVAHSFTRPLHWTGKDFEKLGILLGGTAVLTFTDNSVRAFAQQNREDFPQLVRDFGWYFGSTQNYFMANAGLYGFGLFTKNQRQ